MERLRRLYGNKSQNAVSRSDPLQGSDKNNPEKCASHPSVGGVEGEGYAKSKALRLPSPQCREICIRTLQEQAHRL